MQASLEDQELSVFTDFIWRYFARGNVTIQRIEDAAIELKTTQNISQLEQCLQFPLFLPTNWEMLWEFQSIGSHMVFAHSCSAADF